MRKRNRNIVQLAIIIGMVLIYVVITKQVHAGAVNYTVCDSGCDFTTLVDALADPGLDGDSFIDTVTMTSDYIFNYANETSGGVTLNVPSGVTIDCEAGADVFGDKTEAEMELSANTDFILQNCTTENMRISLYGTNVKLLNNTFSTETNNWITPTGVDGFEISGNSGIQRIQLQGGDNGLIEDNDIECRQDNNCLQIVTNGAPDYTDPPGDPLDDHICNNVVINNNRIVNHIAAGNTGDWILVNGGENIQITNNTISSAVTLTDDPYLVAISVQNAQVEFKNNYFISPQRTSGSTNTTWAFNVRADQYHVDALYENNTIYGFGDDLTCIGFWDGVNDPTLNIDITANYNLCYNGKSSASGSAFNISYDAAPGNANVTLSDTYNGVYNYASPYISDQSGAITSLNANTVTSDPIFRMENADALDNYYPSPISRYYDVDGTKDIGAHSDARVTDYLIDDDCTVDYSTCFSNSSSVLKDAVSTGDTINIAEGVYDAVALDFPASGVTFTGAGDGTVFDASGSGSAFSIENISNSSFSDFQTEGSASVVSTTYTIDHAQYTDGVNTYDEAINLGAPDQSIFIVTSTPAGNSCDTTSYDSDGFDITSVVGSATSNWNLGLMNLLNFARITVLAPDNFVSSGAQLAECSNPGDIVVDYFLEDVYTVDSGVFTYNPGVVSAEGLSIKPGDTNPPSIDRTITAEENGGLLLNDSSNNTFDNITSTDNDFALVFSGSSEDNTISESVFSNSDNADILGASSGDNVLEDTSFSLPETMITGSGDITVKYSLRAYVTDNSDDPLSGASVEITSANSTETAVLTSETDGYTSYSNPLIAYIMSNSSILETAGGYNPYGINASLDDYESNTVDGTLNSPNQTVAVSLTSTSRGSTGYYLPKPSTLKKKVETPMCTRYLGESIKLGVSNNVIEVKKLQAFLRNYEGFDGLVETGVYDKATFEAVIKFQEKYASEVLLPWGLQEGTGYVYQTTLKKINELWCSYNNLTQSTVDIPSTRYSFNRDLYLGIEGEDVRALQKYLNVSNFIVSETGAGSPGIETTYFGSRTQAAVIRFQKANGIVPAVGYFGPITRNVVNTQ